MSVKSEHLECRRGRGWDEDGTAGGLKRSSEHTGLTQLKRVKILSGIDGFDMSKAS